MQNKSVDSTVDTIVTVTQMGGGNVIASYQLVLNFVSNHKCIQYCHV